MSTASSVSSRRPTHTPRHHRPGSPAPLPQLSSGGIEADNVNALASRGEHHGIEQRGISRIDPPGQMENDMAVAKRLLKENRRTCLGAKADRAPDSQDRAAEHRLPLPGSVEQSYKPHKSFF